MPTLRRQHVLCPYPECSSNHGQAEPHVILHASHSTRSGPRRRRLCKVCGRTFSGATGTAYARLRRPKSDMDRAVHMQAEGMTKAAIARVVGLSPSTVTRWLSRAAEHARKFHDAHASLEEAPEVQLDELTCQGTGAARQAWAYSAVEVSSRLWLVLLVGRRTLRNTILFVRDLREVIQEAGGWTVVTSDRFKYYAPAMRSVFRDYPIGYQQVENTYRAGCIVRSESSRVFGSDLIFEWAEEANTDSHRPNTAFIERLNLHQRMCCSLLRRRNPAPARSPEGIQEALELVRVIYNFVRRHSSLRTRRGLETPAMAAGITKRPLTIREILGWVVPAEFVRRRELRALFSRS